MSPLRRWPRRWPLRRALGLALPAVWLPACVEPDTGRHPPGDGHGTAVVELGIDAGAALELAPGEGIGVGVEYAGAGSWSVAATCDTAVTDLECSFDILVSTDERAPITAFERDGLEGGDQLLAPDRFAVSALLETGADLDAFGFTTSPGATVRVSALLYDPGSPGDFSEDPRMISWVGGGAVNRGAPTNPVDLTPDRP